MRDLVDLLIERQEQLRQVDEAFAAELGISRPLWYNIRKRQIPVGLSLLRGTICRFPDLQDAIIEHLRIARARGRGATLPSVA